MLFGESLAQTGALEEANSPALGESCDAHIAAKLPEVRGLELEFAANVEAGFE